MAAMVTVGKPIPAKPCPVAVGLVSLLAFLPLVSGGDILSDFTCRQQEVMAPMQERYHAIATARRDDPGMRIYEERLERLDGIVQHLLSNLVRCEQESAKSLLESLSGTGAELLPVRAQEGPPPPSPIYLLEHYRLDSGPAVPMPAAGGEELSFLRHYYDRRVRVAEELVMGLGYRALLTATDPQTADRVCQICVVLPFLRSPDKGWSTKELGDLPEWLREPCRLHALEGFTLNAGRPLTAWHMRRYGGEGSDSTTGKLGYLCEVAATMMEHREWSAGRQVCVLGGEIAQEAKNETMDITFGCQLARALASTGHPSDAALQLRTLVDRYPQTPQYGRLATTMVTYLYRARQFEAVRRTGADCLADPRSRGYSPHLMYLVVFASRCEGRLDEADAMERDFLKRFPEHPLALDIYFAQGLRALSLGDRDKALGYLDAVEFRSPRPGLRERVRVIRDRIRTGAVRHTAQVIGEVADPWSPEVHWLIYDTEFVGRLRGEAAETYDAFREALGGGAVRTQELALGRLHAWALTDRGVLRYDRATDQWSQHAGGGGHAAAPELWESILAREGIRDRFRVDQDAAEFYRIAAEGR